MNSRRIDIVRIVRVPAIETAIARFDAWWNQRQPRERVLLGVLFALLAGVVLVYGIIKPLQAARADALADIRTYETLNARIRASGLLTPGNQAAAAPARQRSGTPVQIVSDSAQSFGVAATAAAIPGGVRATIADAPYDAIVSWLSDLGTTSQMRVRSVTLQRGPAVGRVAATVEFAQ